MTTITKERAAELLSSQPEATKQGLPDVGVCVQCLSSYNQGEHHWVWVDLIEMADQGETLDECIQWMLASSPAAFAEEWVRIPVRSLSVFDQTKERYD